MKTTVAEQLADIIDPIGPLEDPIGPGSAAWTAYENALTAYAKVPKGQHDGRLNKDYKSYSNYRQYMIARLHEAGAPRYTIEQWCKTLRQMCRDHVMDEYGEWIA